MCWNFFPDYVVPVRISQILSSFNVWTSDAEGSGFVWEGTPTASSFQESCPFQRSMQQHGNRSSQSSYQGSGKYGTSTLRGGSCIKDLHSGTRQDIFAGAQRCFVNGGILPDSPARRPDGHGLRECRANMQLNSGEDVPKVQGAPRRKV